MAGLVPAIHVFGLLMEDVDARHKAGHDGDRRQAAGLLTAGGVFVCLNRMR